MITPEWQTLVALLIVALAALLLLRTALMPRRPGSHHGGMGCPMLSTEMKSLHTQIAKTAKHRGRTRGGSPVGHLPPRSRGHEAFHKK